MTISYDDFAKVDIRVGTVRSAQPLEGARKPAIRLEIDFGPEIGVKKSSAQLTVHYAPEKSGRPPGRGGGQFPAAPDRQVHVGSVDARLP